MTPSSCLIYHYSFTKRQIAPLAAAAVPFVITSISDAIKNAITQSHNNLQTQYIAYATRFVDSSNKEPFCLDIVRGIFLLNQNKKLSNNNQGIQFTSLYGNLHLAKPPFLFVEIFANYDKYSKSYLFEPVAVLFNKTAAANPGWSHSKDIGIMLSFSTSPPNLAANATAADAAKAATIFVPMDLGVMKQGEFILTPKQNAEVQKLAANSPTPVDLSTDPFADQIRSVPVDIKKVGQLNAYAIVTESSNPNFFDKIVLDSVSGTSLNTLLTSIASGLTKSSSGSSHAAGTP